MMSLVVIVESLYPALKDRRRGCGALRAGKLAFGLFAACLSLTGMNANALDHYGNNLLPIQNNSVAPHRTAAKFGGVIRLLYDARLLSQRH